MVPQPTDGLPGCTYYMTLMRGDLQIRIDECVYLERDDNEAGETNKLTCRQLQTPTDDRMYIFRVERLWKDERYTDIQFGQISIIYDPVTYF